MTDTHDDLIRRLGEVIASFWASPAAGSGVSGQTIEAVARATKRRMSDWDMGIVEEARDALAASQTALREADAERAMVHQRAAENLRIAVQEKRRAKTAEAENARLRALLAGAVSEGRRARHLKRGTTYQVLTYPTLQTDRPLTDYAELVVYRCEQTGKTWARPVDEFEDPARFEELPAQPEGDDNV